MLVDDQEFTGFLHDFDLATFSVNPDSEAWMHSSELEEAANEIDEDLIDPTARVPF